MVDKFMKNAKGLSRNPLGIIALFVSLIYGFACLVLSGSLSNLKGNIERLPLIWFVIGFPILILISFILLVIFHHEKLYAPIDYKDESNFVSTFKGKEFRFAKVKDIEITNDTTTNKKNFKQLVLKPENVNYNKELFPKEAKSKLDLANKIVNKLSYYTENEAKKGYITGFGFGIQAPEYFLLRYTVPEKFLRQKGNNFRDTIIIRVTENKSGELTIIGIGKDIEETSAEKFAEKLSIYIREVLLKIIQDSNQE